MEPIIRLVSLLAISAVIVKCQDFTICAKPGLFEPCQQISRNLTFACDIVYNNADCLLNVDSGKTSIGVVSAEEAFLAAPLTTNVVVIGEKHTVSNETPTQTVVIVKSDYNGGVAGLQTKKYCHPGFKYKELVTPLLLQEFENVVLSRNSVNICSNEGTLLEKYIKSLSEFFGPSCRPGAWTVNITLNAQLQSTYSSLCSLCASQSCEQPSTDPFQESLDCLVNNDADVAFTALDKAEVFFQSVENAQKYKYLCKDDTTSSPLTPCVWSKQLRTLIVANSAVAVSARTTLERWLENYIVGGMTPFGLSGSALTSQLLNVLKFQEDTEKVRFLGEINLKNYVSEFRDIPDEKNELCDRNVKWCTTSPEEKQKCLWLSQAALNRAIQPVVKCVESSSQLECINDVKNNKADLLTIDAGYGFIAKRNNLAAIAFPETAVSDLLMILIVVTEGSSIERLENLRSKSACFPEYGGIEFLTWVDVGRTKGILPTDTCDYGKLVSDFVSDSCVPGTNSDDHAVTSGTDIDKLCSHCQSSNSPLTAKNCNADETNNYYGSEGALKCLSQVGQFAVITKQSFSIDTSNFRVLCKNGTLASYTGLDVDSDCALAVITKTEVVTRRNSTKREDIDVALQEFEEWFGVNSHKPFELFNVFNGTKDLLFKDSTPGLEFSGSGNQYIQNYVSLFSHIDQCAAAGTTSAAGSSVISSFLFMFLFIAFYNSCKCF